MLMKINYKTYKGKGRPRQKDYHPKLWDKWGTTIIIFTVFTLSVVFWFGGAVRIQKAFAETQRPFLSPEPTTGRNVFTFVDKPKNPKKPYIESLFYKYDWNAEVMITVCKSEIGFEYQGWKQDAIFKGNSDGSVDTGLCMINSNTFADFVRRGKLSPDLDLTNAEDNIYSAYVIWTEQGYEAWTKYKDGGYKKYLN